MVKRLIMRLPLVRTCVCGNDLWGSGEFQAPRGKREHKGIDIVAHPGYEVIACCIGEISKIGYPCGQSEPDGGFKNEDKRRTFYLKKAMRYVEVTTPGRYRVRHFYMDRVRF
jgi:hypothetical protein